MRALFLGLRRPGTHEDDFINLLGNDDLRDRDARDLLAIDGDDLVGGAHDAIDACCGDLGLALRQITVLLLEGTVGVGDVNRLGSEGGGARRDRDPVASALRIERVDALIRRVDTGGPAVLTDTYGGVGSTGDRHRHGQGHQTCAQHHGSGAPAPVVDLVRGRHVQVLRRGMGMTLAGGSHGGDVLPIDGG